MFNHAIRQRQWCSANPLFAVARCREQGRVRYLSADELDRLDAALSQCASPQAADLVRLLFLTGAKRGETLSAQWDEFDLDQGTWTKPSHRTKQKAMHTIPLLPQAIELLRTMKQRAQPEQSISFRTRTVGLLKE
jgi:integrase